MKSDGFLYEKIYFFYKELIETGKLPQGAKLPSIRRCAQIRQVSKTTVEQAYINLCDDGYLLPKSQSGYYVSYTGRQREESKAVKREESAGFVSDYASTGVDSTVFDLSLWTRYVKNALKHADRLKDYGIPQGERELREQIANYTSSTRNCVCDESNIVIGAGVQTLLNILCALTDGREKSIYFNDSAYRQGIAVFKDRGYKITDDAGDASILYISPSHAAKRGDIISINRRHSLVQYARKNGKLIIEDDYDSEFRDLNRPTPSLQSLDSENVVYLGTFSKLLLPSLRISYMILPPALTQKYALIGDLYNQTVSIPDQIALKNYIYDGRLSSQIKKARKLYTQKSKLLTDAVISCFGDRAEIERTATPLYVRCTIKSGTTLNELVERLKSRPEPIRIIPVEEKDGKLGIAFSVSAVNAENIEPDIKKIAEILL